MVKISKKEILGITPNHAKMCVRLWVFTRYKELGSNSANHSWLFQSSLYQALLFRFGLIIPVFLRNFADVIL